MKRFVQFILLSASLMLLASGHFVAPAWAAEKALPGTEPLVHEGDLAWDMVEGIDRFLLAETAAAQDGRAARWKRDFASAEAYEKSIAPQRAQLAKILGVIDQRASLATPEYSPVETQAIGHGAGFQIHALRWPVLPGVEGEGLLLWPDSATARDPNAVFQAPVVCIALGDADHTPEMLAGLSAGVAPEAQFARRLAECGVPVIVPQLIDRSNAFSQAVYGTMQTKQPHREFIYRQAYEMGRHLIGYEAQKTLALVDLISARAENQPAPRIGVYGYGAGGMIALDAAALDPRISAAGISGRFANRQNLWQEPIDHNVFALLNDFGDAELATMLAARKLIVEAARGPEVTSRPYSKERQPAPTPGNLTSPARADVAAEVERAQSLASGIGAAEWIELVESGAGDGPPGCDAALAKFVAALDGKLKFAPANQPAQATGALPDPAARQQRQVGQLVDFTQRLMHDSPHVRGQYWAAADRKSRDPEAWSRTTAALREKFYREVIGRFDRQPLPPRPRARVIYDEPKYTAYEVVLDVFPDVFAYGILMLPKDLQAGERRPVVVCQHGLEGRPQDLCAPGSDHPAYHRYAGVLAERGFITYSPQNPYIFNDYFRSLQRKANPLGKTLYSIIVPQHQQTVDWLASLPMVDPDRIAFYGLSYGGKTAMRVPSLVDEYCLSICSGDFNEWIWKNVSVTSPVSYMRTQEYEMYEFDLGNTFNYFEMAGLICPRPFMVERGHRDGVAPDEWVAYEFAKVKLLYTDLKIGDRAEIEFFDGPHTIHGVGTYAFLHKHLKWPEPR